MQQTDKVIKEYLQFISNKEFPCVAAKDAMAKDRVKLLVVDNIACPKDDKAIVDFLYSFTDFYRNSSKGFYSAAIIFNQQNILEEEMFDKFMWQRLQSISNIDSLKFGYDKRVASNPAAANFSFSIMEEAFFIVGLHPQSSRPARRFAYPTLVFNPHAQFEEMKKDARYEKMKTIVRKRDVVFSGSVNPMLTEFGKASEVYQYSGRNYDSKWKCPFIPQQ
jgi:uncharacterized protein